MFERYDVSTMGNVRRGGKLLTPGLDTYGYRQVNLYKDSIRYTKKVYRLVMDAFNPNIENKPQIDHINRNRSDDRLENLRWVTISENCRNRTNFDEEMLGICWSKKNSRYMVRLTANGKETYYGSRETLEDAKTLRDQVIRGDAVFTPNKERDTYGISLLSRGFYQVRVNGKTIGYKKTFEEAKDLRDNHVVNDKNESCEF